MRPFRLLAVALALLVVTPLSPAVAAGQLNVDVVAVVDGQGQFASVTVFCHVIAEDGAATTPVTSLVVTCDAWDSVATSISHVRNFTGNAGLCYFKSNQMTMPIAVCVRAEAQFLTGARERAEKCVPFGTAELPHRPPPTNGRSTLECLEPVPVPV